MRAAPRVARHGSFPTTADMGLWARGPTPESLFEGLAEALFGAMTDLRSVRPRERRTLARSSPDPAALAVGFLSDLLLLFQTEDFLVRSASVRLAGRGRSELRATVSGEPFDAARHPRRIEVKAITWHAAVVDLARGRARVVIDI